MSPVYHVFHIGIKGKLSLLFVLFSVLPLTIIGYYSYHTATQSLIENILATDQQQVGNLADNIQNSLDAVPGNFRFLASFYALRNFLQWQTIGEPYKTQQALNDTRKAFLAFMESKETYLQLQLVDPQGQEMLRLEYDPIADKVEVISPNELQNKQTDYPFLKAGELKQDEIYFNTLYFNEENKASKPILQYVTPIITQNLQGFLLLHLDAEIFLETIREANEAGRLNNQSSYFLVNQDGEYLFYPFSGQEFSKLYRSSLKQDDPELFEAIIHGQRGTFSKTGMISTFQKFFPLSGSSIYWVLIKQTNEKVALTKVRNFEYLFVFTIMGIVILVLLISFWITKSLINPLLKVNIHLKLLAKGKLIEELIEYKKNDEIGELVLSTGQLKNSMKNTIAQANAIAAGNYSKEVQLLSQQDQLGQALSNMTRTLCQVTDKNASQDWLKTAQNQLNEKMSGEQEIITLAQNIIQFLTTCLQAQLGVFYLVEEADAFHPYSCLRLIASYAYTRRKNLASEFQFGEGLVGQVALERQPILVTQVPENYVTIHSALGEAPPRNILVMPFMYENTLKGVIELGTFPEFTELQLEFLKNVTPSIGIAVQSAQSRSQLQELLQQTQLQAEELQSQAEELQSQQQELRQTNEELEERSRQLEQQKEEIREKNLALEKSQQAIAAKAKELELANKYKSEFLANMSHELRTPLNSLLILAQLLADNKEGNLTNKQVEYAKTVHSAGSDLLTLINDILDLSKVEAGRIEIHPEEVSLRELVNTIKQKFQHVAEEKGIAFQVTLAPRIPTKMYTDPQRLKQIINNLLSNAFKFTSQGYVQLSIQMASPPPSLNKNDSEMIAISVTDTGIGIPKDKHQVIFDAFQQADGTTSRRYGGTGLGLTISRQLVRLLGGEILLESKEGKGSTFTFYLPSSWVEQKKIGTNIVLDDSTKKDDEDDHETVEINAEIHNENSETESFSEVSPEIPPSKGKRPVIDDRDHLKPEDRLILIVEDDRKFSNLLRELANEKNFKCLIAEDGKIGLQMVEQYKPHAIILDVTLPQVDGWTVMEKLKDNPDTRHIPVHFISGADHKVNAKKMGAIDCLLKPISLTEIGEAFRKIEQFITKQVKNLLVFMDDLSRQQEVIDLVDSEGVEFTLTATQQEALQHLHMTSFDCIVIDVGVEQGKGIQFLEVLYKEEKLSHIPIVLYMDHPLSSEEETILQRYEDKLTVKTVNSPERLLAETTLFLHQVEAKLPKEKRKMLQMVHDKSLVLANRKVLVVDDDVRNTFALATILEDKNMEVVVAKNGKEALKLLETHHDIDLILMDIMMPEMDGYEAMQKIRAQPRYRKLPIIALTAKAMKGDKNKCIEAGANDYLAKPVDTDKLVSLMRVWLYR